MGELSFSFSCGVDAAKFERKSRRTVRRVAEDNGERIPCGDMVVVAVEAQSLNHRPYLLCSLRVTIEWT